MKIGRTGIYKRVCTNNGDYYYGSSKIILYRWESHKRELRKQKHINYKIQTLWNQYGESSFRLELVETVLIDKLFEVEDRYLKEYVGKPHCLNISQDAYAPTRNRKHIPCSEETKEKIRQTLMGHSVSNITRQKISEAQIGKTRAPYPPITEETRQKMRESHLGIKYPDRKSISFADRQNRMGPRQYNCDIRLKFSKAKRPAGFLPVKAPDGQIYTIEILSDLCREHKLSINGMSRMILGQRKRYRGWTLA